MQNDRMNTNSETLLTWAKKIGLAPMLTFELIIQDSYVHERKVYWNSNMKSRKKIADNMGISDTRVKQNVTVLYKYSILTRESKGIYIVNERVASIMVEHPTKKGK